MRLNATSTTKNLIHAIMAAAGARLKQAVLPTAPIGGYFLGQHQNHKRNAERQLCKRLGRRQYLKLFKSRRRQAKTL
jgi:hypothetical protein